MKPLLGVIGGMGTQATACFYEKLHSLQTVKAEQEYLDVLVYSMPSIPDRTAFITGQSDISPLEPLIHVARTLESAGASCIAIPCVTSHFFYNELVDAVGIPVLNMLDETAGFVSGRGIGRVCLLATDGTLKGGAFNAAFAKIGIEVVVPPVDVQAALMAVIYDVKRGAAVSPDLLDAIAADALGSAAVGSAAVGGATVCGATAVILGCTELCVIAHENPGVVNTLEVLAGAALRVCKA